MTICQYRYNPSELYQRTPPGCGLETICGAPTYPIVDEPEIRVMRVEYKNDDPDKAPDFADEARPTGRLLPRAHHDPYCPAHGGTLPPPPEPVSMTQLELAHAQYLELASRFQTQNGGAIAAPVPVPAAIAAPPVTAEDVQKAAENYAALAAGKAE